MCKQFIRFLYSRRMEIIFQNGNRKFKILFCKSNCPQRIVHKFKKVWNKNEIMSDWLW